MRNVEIKAIARNLSQLIEKAKSLADKHEVIKQFDTFFQVPTGRLKLRQFKDKDVSELIFYQRPDCEGPKLSSFEKCNLAANDASNLRDVLIASLGEKGTVSKTRYLYMVGQTRVHIDAVDGLGDFVELEVTLSDEESVEEGEKIAKDLMAKLGIDEADLISGAYVDMPKPNC